jgi:hypothetical protein
MDAGSIGREFADGWDRVPTDILTLAKVLDKARSTRWLLVRSELHLSVYAYKKINNAHVFEPVISRNSVQHRMIDELVGLFGGKALPIVTHLIDSGKLTRDEVREAQRALRDLARKDKT